MRSVIAFALLAVSLAGWITPKTTTPILPSYNNKDYVGDYTFTF
jgi:hypothetical protein